MTTTRDVAAGSPNKGSSTKVNEHTLTFTDESFDQLPQLICFRRLQDPNTFPMIPSNGSSPRSTP